MMMCVWLCTVFWLISWLLWVGFYWNLVSWWKCCKLNRLIVLRYNKNQLSVDIFPNLFIFLSRDRKGSECSKGKGKYCCPAYDTIWINSDLVKIYSVNLDDNAPTHERRELVNNYQKKNVLHWWLWLLEYAGRPTNYKKIIDGVEKKAHRHKKKITRKIKRNREKEEWSSL